MAYTLRYQTELYTRNGHSFRLLVYDKEPFVGSVQTIGNLSALSLDIQGDAEAVDTPIIKTSLSWTVADEQEKGVVGGVRYGHWESLYTSDATRFKVVLQRDGSAAWTGYLTPDSWEESLTFNSYLTFTARDNIGHLRDFEYDDYPLISNGNTASVSAIITKALDLIDCGMSLSVYNESSWLSVGGHTAYDFTVNTATMEGRDWYDVLETTLDTFGLVLRYTGGNTLTLAPLRYLPQVYGITKDANLINRSGHRSLDPAYKQIVDNGDYELCDPDAPTFDEGDFSGNTLVKDGWDCDTGAAVFYGSSIRSAEESTSEDTLIPASSDPSRYFLLQMGVPPAKGQTAPAYKIAYSVNVANSTSVNLSFKVDNLYIRSSGSWSAGGGRGYLYYRVEFAYRTAANREVVQYLTEGGEWKLLTDSTIDCYTQMMLITEAQNVAVNTNTPSGRAGTIRLRLYAAVGYADGSWFTRVGDITTEVGGTSIPRKYKITTTYDSAQNTTLKRDAAYVICPKWLKANGVIKNGIYLPSAVNGSECVFDVQWAGTGASLPMPVFVHLQRIAYHSQTNSIFTGDLQADDISFGEKWHLYDRTCLLVGGTMDFIKGVVYGAKMAEYVPYATLFGNITSSSINYNYTAEKYGSGSAVTGGGGGGGTGTVTSVGLKMPDDFEVEDSPIETEGEITVTRKTGYLKVYRGTGSDPDTLYVQ